MQLEQELASARGGGDGGGSAALDEQISHYDRVYKGTRASMEDAGCFETFFIFGRGLVRSPKCLTMNQRLEDARRQLSRLQQQRDAASSGGGNRRRQAELRDALARSGCGRGEARQASRRGGGLFDWFGGGQEEETYDDPGLSISRSINPGGRYRSLCVRLCDGFFYPISYSTYGNRLAQDAEQCQNNCAAPAELYVYRNPGQEPKHAISLNGSAYIDLPVAFKYRQEYVNGCSCKQSEYNPTKIEAANKAAAAETTEATDGKPGKKKAAAPVAAAPKDASGAQTPPPQLDLDITGTAAADPEPAPQEAAPAPAAPAPVAPAPPAAAQAAPPQQPAAQAQTDTQGQSTVVKRKATPVIPQ